MYMEGFSYQHHLQYRGEILMSVWYATRTTFIPSTFLEINIFETKIPGLRLKLAKERATDRHDNPIILICVEMRLKNRCLISILGTKHSLVEETG